MFLYIKAGIDTFHPDSRRARNGNSLYDFRYHFLFFEREKAGKNSKKGSVSDYQSMGMQKMLSERKFH